MLPQPTISTVFKVHLSLFFIAQFFHRSFDTIEFIIEVHLDFPLHFSLTTCKKRAGISFWLIPALMMQSVFFYL